MATINTQLNVPNGAGGFDSIQPQTNLNMINDMSAFMRLLNVAADATAARKTLDAAATNHGIHVPAGGTNTQFLRGDLTWQSIQTVIGQGFVAQSLQQSGWVKAANGLIIQWGISGSYGNVDAVMYVTYPVAFSWFGIPVGVVFSGMRDTDGSGGDNIQSYSNSGFVYSHGANSRPSSVLYMAIGI